MVSGTGSGSPISRAVRAIEGAGTAVLTDPANADLLHQVAAGGPGSAALLASGCAALQRGLYRALLGPVLGTPLPDAALRGPDDGRWGCVRVTGGPEVGDVTDLGRIHEGLKEFTPVWDGALRLQPGPGRHGTGTFYTPAPLVEHLLDTALEPVLEGAMRHADPERALAAIRVCDPTCGSGLFLVAAAQRVAGRLAALGAPGAAAARCVRGIDIDPVAVDLARVSIWVAAGGPDDFSAFVDAVRVGDALQDEWYAEHDVVVGNPPFLNRLGRGTALDAAAVARVRELVGTATGAYTDVSALILLRSLDLLRPGGRACLVQPQSLLASRDGAAVRRRLLERARLAHLWATDEPVFEGSSVLTCAPTLVVGERQGSVSVTHGPAFARMRPVGGPAPDSEWSYLLAEGLGLPPLELQASGQIGDVASCTADFRDQYYGLVPYVADGDPDSGHARLITSGLIEPAECRWGRAPVRFAKRRFERPVADLAGLRESALADWAQQRLVPKVLVATQSRVIEAVVDEGGAWLPSVPVVTVMPPPDRLWHVLAVLCAPPVTAYACVHWAGTGLSMRAIKLSAKQVASLPLPADRDLWDEGAGLARAAQHAPSPEARADRLADLAQVMTAAYATSDDVRAWWLERARTQA